MKTFMRLSIVLLFIICFSACTGNEKIRDDIYRGIYEESNRTQEMKNEHNLPLPEDKPLTYDQYKRERQEMLEGDKADQ